MTIKEYEERVDKLSADGLVAACKKQIEYAYQSAAQMVGLTLRDVSEGENAAYPPK